MGTFAYFWAPDEGVDVEDIRALVPYVVESAPGTDPNEVRRALAAAVHRFLADTGCWRKEGVPAVAGTGEVRVGSGGCSRILAVESITRVADEVVVYDAVSQYTMPTSRLVRDDGSGMYVLTEPNAAEGDEYTANLVLSVRLGSELCPRWVIERWGEAIASKATHELVTKGQLAPSSHLALYREAVQSIIARRAMGGSARSSGPGSALSNSVERI